MNGYCLKQWDSLMGNWDSRTLAGLIVGDLDIRVVRARNLQIALNTVS